MLILSGLWACVIVLDAVLCVAHLVRPKVSLEILQFLWILRPHTCAHAHMYICLCACMCCFYKTPAFRRVSRCALARTPTTVFRCPHVSTRSPPWRPSDQKTVWKIFLGRKKPIEFVSHFIYLVPLRDLSLCGRRWCTSCRRIVRQPFDATGHQIGGSTRNGSCQTCPNFFNIFVFRALGEGPAMSEVSAHRKRSGGKGYHLLLGAAWWEPKWPVFSVVLFLSVGASVVRLFSYKTSS